MEVTVEMEDYEFETYMTVSKFFDTLEHWRILTLKGLDISTSLKGLDVYDLSVYYKGERLGVIEVDTNV